MLSACSLGAALPRGRPRLCRAGGTKMVDGLYVLSVKQTPPLAGPSPRPRGPPRGSGDRRAGRRERSAGRPSVSARCGPTGAHGSAQASAAVNTKCVSADGARLDGRRARTIVLGRAGRLTSRPAAPKALFGRCFVCGRAGHRASERRACEANSVDEENVE